MAGLAVGSDWVGQAAKSERECVRGQWAGQTAKEESKARLDN